MSAPRSPAIEDYLKAIFNLTHVDEATGANSIASTSAIAACLNVTSASVTGMIQRLVAIHPPLVDYRRHQGVTLTAEGERAALEVIRHHRLIESYLVFALGYSWDDVHEEACRLEHVISEDFEARIDQALGHPERDPHGEPIPSAELALFPDNLLSLVELRPTQRARVQRVRADDPALLRFLDELGATPGADLRVLEHSPFDGNLTVQIRDREPTVLGPAITSKIFVEEIL